MKQLVLLLASILLYSIVCSQEIRGKRISCVDGIPLECLKTGDVLQGEEVAYDTSRALRQSDSVSGQGCYFLHH